MTKEELDRNISFYQDKLRALRDNSTVSDYDKNRFDIDGTDLVKYYGNENTVRIPYGVTKIVNNAFKDCKNLVSVILPDSVTRIEGVAFKGCSNLKYNVYDKTEYLASEDNPYYALFDASDLDDFNHPRKTCKIHPDTKIICDIAFTDCDELRKIDIPDGVLYIGEDAFKSCGKITEVTVPDSVIEIYDYAFCLNDNLKKVILPYKLFSIGDKTYCRVEKMGEAVFFDCPKLTVYCEAESKPEEWDDGWDDDAEDNTKIKVVWGYKG